MLFDKEFEFKGKYATYCRFLKNDIGLFKTFREAYATSALIGFLFSIKKIDNDEKVQTASILASELAQKRTDLTYIYRLIMLLDSIPNATILDIQNRTFKDDAESDNYPEKVTKNMATFNTYANGGIEFLYERFKNCSEVKDTINELNDFILEFIEDNAICS